MTNGIKKSENGATIVIPSLETVSSPETNQEQRGMSANKITDMF